MSTASIGRASEAVVAMHMAASGWQKIMRAAASKGSGDLLMGHHIHGAALVQVGRRSKTLGPADRERLCDDAELISALPLLAIHVPHHGVTIWHVTRDSARHWARWED